MSPISPLAGPFLQRFAEGGMEPTAAVRRNLLDDRSWYNSAYYRDRRRAMGFDDILLSAIVLPGQVPSIAVVALSRPLGRTVHFDERETEWVNLVHAELRWAYEVHSPAPEEHLTPVDPAGRMVNVSPRLQRVLRCLLEGQREKEVARGLGLSPHTVHQYVKMLYKELHVASRAELLALWVRGESGPLPPFRGWGVLE